MRTALSLDDDVANLLKKEMRRSGSSLTETVNDFLRHWQTICAFLRIATNRNAECPPTVEDAARIVD